MKRLQYDRYGGPEVLRLAEFEPPRPRPDEVRVRAAASNAPGRRPVRPGAGSLGRWQPSRHCG
ncbi:hypothetical protein [Actinophytocola oryzae]|uniref:hypothetical protein n=1 Tax=Actinophytocola oryzae TaxID=502181 RepID=UPI001AAE91A1|nr:hypothetical protein [Actinophytocola oryzae]